MNGNDTEPAAKGGGTSPLVWILVGFLLAANLGLVGYLFLGGDDSVEPAQEVAVSTIETTAPTTTEPASTTTAAVTTTTEAPATTTTAAPTTTVAPTTTLVPLESLPPRGAVYRDGKLYLQGAVPTEEIAQQFVDRAAEVIGAENVINEYVVRPDAPEPTDGNVRVEQAVLFESGSAVIAPDLEPIGFGETEPVADNESPEGRRINRRIEVRLIDLLLPQE